jgi:hypothetical protein
VPRATCTRSTRPAVCGPVQLRDRCRRRWTVVGMWGQALVQAWWCHRCEVGETTRADSAPPTCFNRDAPLRPRTVSWDPTARPLEDPCAAASMSGQSASG